MPAKTAGNCKQCGTPTSALALICSKCRVLGAPCTLCGRPLGQSKYQKCRACLDEREKKILSEHFLEKRPYRDTAEAINALRKGWFPKGAAVNLISEGGVPFQMARAGLISQMEARETLEKIRKDRAKRKREEATPREIRLWVMKRDQDLCSACTEPGNVVATIIQSGKKDDPRNLVTLCRPCFGLVRKGWVWTQHWFSEYARNEEDVFFRLRNYREALGKLDWRLVSVVIKTSDGRAILFQVFPKEAPRPFYVENCGNHYHLLDAKSAEKVDPKMRREVQDHHDLCGQCAAPKKGHHSNSLPKAAPGRNDPCSCGSGRKYKKCCGK